MDAKNKLELQQLAWHLSRWPFLSEIEAREELGLPRAVEPAPFPSERRKDGVESLSSDAPRNRIWTYAQRGRQFAN